MLPLRPMLAKFVLLLSLGLVTSVANAGTVHLTLNGQVDFSNISSVSVGQHVAIVITYDSNAVPQYVQNQQGIYGNAMSSISVDVGSYHTSYSAGMFGQIDKYDNLSGFDGIQFQAAANPATYQYASASAVSLAAIQQGQILSPFDYLIINLARNSGDLWSGYALPASYNFADFDQTVNFGFAFQNGSFGGGFTNLLVSDGVTGTPEPGTWVLAGVSLLGLLSSRIRRG